jgi:hypothetical protein
MFNLSNLQILIKKTLHSGVYIFAISSFILGLFGLITLSINQDIRVFAVESTNNSTTSTPAGSPTQSTDNQNTSSNNKVLDSNTAAGGTLTKCNFSAGDAGQVVDDPTNAFQDCIGQIFQFVVVISILLIFFRIGQAALQSYNPLAGGGSATNNAVTLVWDVVLGLLFIGGPYLILNTLNPALTKFNIVDIGGILKNITPNSQNSGGAGGTSNNNGTSSGTNTNSGAKVFGSTTVNGVADSVGILQNPTSPIAANITKENPKGTPPTQTQRDAAAKTMNTLYNDYYSCHRHLITATQQSKCTTWESLTEADRTKVVQDIKIFENLSDFKDKINTAQDNIGFKLLGSEMYINTQVTPSSFSGLAPITDLTSGGKCKFYYLKMSPGGKDSSRVDSSTLKFKTFQTKICNQDTANPFFDKVGTEWKLKNKIFQKGKITNISEPHTGAA